MRTMRYFIYLQILIVIGPSLLFGLEERTGELVARHAAALGGREAVRALQSVSSTAEIEIIGTGLKGTVESRSLRPCLSFSEVTLGFFKVREGYDGERIWMIDPNGKLQLRRDAASHEYQKTMCLVESQEYLFEEEGFSLAAAGKDTIGADAYEVLDLTIEEGAAARIFLNDSTYLVDRLEIKAAEGEVVQTFGDYRPVGGVMFPFFVRTEMPALGQRIEIRFLSIVPNEPIDPVVFLTPATDVKDYRFAGRGAVEEVPFEYRLRHLFVPARITGYASGMPFLLDSGAGMTVIDSAVAAMMRLPHGGILPGAAAGGMADFSMTRIPGFTIAGVELLEQTAISFPVSGLLKEMEGMEIGGILGYDFLSRFVTRIDFERALLSCFEPDSFAAPVGATVLEAPLAHNIFTLSASLDGTEGLFYLDTGANSSLIQGTFVDSAGLARGRRTQPIEIRGAGGEEEAALCRFDSLRIGDYVLAQPVLAITRGGEGISALKNVDGIIGNDILERFTVTLDYRRQRVFLEKNARYEEAFYRDRSGLQLVRKDDGRIVVAHALAGSPAEIAGMLPGDIIIAIDRSKAKRFQSVEEIMRLFEGKEGTTCRIEMMRGGRKRTLSLTLARYI